MFQKCGKAAPEEGGRPHMSHMRNDGRAGSV